MSFIWTFLKMIFCMCQILRTRSFLCIRCKPVKTICSTMRHRISNRITSDWSFGTSTHSRLDTPKSWCPKLHSHFFVFWSNWGLEFGQVWNKLWLIKVFPIKNNYFNNSRDSVISNYSFKIQDQATTSKYLRTWLLVKVGPG